MLMSPWFILHGPMGRQRGGRLAAFELRWGEAEDAFNGKFDVSGLVFSREAAERRLDAGPSSRGEQCLKLGACRCSFVSVAKQQVIDNLGFPGSWGKVCFPVNRIVLGPDAGCAEDADAESKEAGFPSRCFFFVLSLPLSFCVLSALSHFAQSAGLLVGQTLPAG